MMFRSPQVKTTKASAAPAIRKKATTSLARLPLFA
jgi:hypothetical protein